MDKISIILDWLMDADNANKLSTIIVSESQLEVINIVCTKYHTPNGVFYDVGNRIVRLKIVEP